jgi:hypothetical protein
MKKINSRNKGSLRTATSASRTGHQPNSPSVRASFKINSRDKGKRGERSFRTGTINSRQKGKRGERQWRDELRANGYAARRGQQFSGSPESPDVVCDGLPWAHFEVKLVERLNVGDAMAQARKQVGPAPNAAGAAGPTASASNRGKVPFVAHRKNYWPWLVTMEVERFYRFLRRDLTGDWAIQMAAGSTPTVACAEFAWLRCATAGHRANIHEFMRETEREQAEPAPNAAGAAPAKVIAIAHQDRDARWLVTVAAETFFNFLRGVLPPEGKQQQP